MIEMNDFFAGIRDKVGLWCGGDFVGVDLARMAQIAVEQQVGCVSVVPDSVGVLCPWLEKTSIEILGRFYLPDVRVNEKAISDVTVQINNAFKHGATGAQVFVRYKKLAELVQQVAIIRDDLFFNRKLIIGLDIADIGPYDWANVFDNLKKIRADAVMFALTRDTGDKSDFVGRVYGMLENWDSGFVGELHWALGNNPVRIEQANRLVESMQANLVHKQRFWLNWTGE